MIEVNEHGGFFGGSKGLGPIVPIFFQATPPNTNKVGALWVEMPKSPVGTIFISDLTTPAGVTLADGDFYIKLSDFATNFEISPQKRLIFGVKSTKAWEFLKGFSGAYPTAALHREGGKWTSKQMSVWNGKEWIVKALSGGYLYKAGAIGIMEKGYTWSDRYTSLIFNTDNVDLQARADDTNSNIAVTTSIPVDLTGINNVYCDWEGLSSNPSYGQCCIMAHSLKNQAPASSGVPSTLYQGGVFTRTIHKLNVAELTGMYYLSFHAIDSSAHSGNSTMGRVKIFNIWTL